MDLKRRHILLVDDDAGHAYLTQRNLQRFSLDMDIEWVGSGSEALSTLEEAQSKNQLPDLILLDLNMPGLSGFDVLENLDKDEQLKAIPRFIISTSDEPDDMKKSEHFGYVEYVIKPIDYPVLIDQIKQLFKETVEQEA